MYHLPLSTRGIRNNKNAKITKTKNSMSLENCYILNYISVYISIFITF